MKMKLSIALVLLTSAFSLQAVTTLNYNDMLPAFSTNYPFELMNEEAKEVLKDSDSIKGIYERMQISASFIGQKATRARNLNKDSVPAGDVHGRLNMVGLLYGDVPTGSTRPNILNAMINLKLYGLGGNPPDEDSLNRAGLETNDVVLSNDYFTDRTQNFGFFSLPVKYRKIAGRFKASVRIVDDVVISVQMGVADMKQTITEYVDRTKTMTDANYEDVYHDNILANSANFAIDRSVVESNLMDRYNAIFTALGVNGEDWSETSPEDVSISLAWRHNFRVNKEEDPKDWSRFIFTPHALFAVTLGAGKASDSDILLSLPFGNNKHNAVHFSSGFNIDFYENVEASFEAGATHFFDRSYKTRVPTSQFQSVLFPYKTDVKVEPGKTWHINIGMNARHFLEKLSMYAVYSYVQHLKDTITLTNPPSPTNSFLPARLEDQTVAKTQMANIGFNYDLSPNMTVGFLWQAPITQRAAYKSTTIALSLETTF